MDSSPLIFFGNERWATGLSIVATPVIETLIKTGVNIAAIVANQETPRSRQARPLEIAAVAQRHSIPLLLPDHPADIIPTLTKLAPAAGIVAAYGRILPTAIIDLFPQGLINLHPSLLPLYRGPTPIETAILDGQSVTGVSIMRLESKMDAGPIYVQQEVALSKSESKTDLAETLSKISAQILQTHLTEIISGKLIPQAQDETKATYTKLLTKSDGHIDWTKSAQRLEREVRAYLGWPGSRTRLFDQDITITKAHAVPSQEPSAKPGYVEAIRSAGVILVTTGNGSLCIDRLIPAGKRDMTGREFLAGRTLN